MSSPWIDLGVARALLSITMGSDAAEAEMLLSLRRGRITAHAETLWDMDAQSMVKTHLGYKVELEPGFWIEVDSGRTNNHINWPKSWARYGFGPPPGQLRIAEQIYFLSADFQKAFDLPTGENPTLDASAPPTFTSAQKEKARKLLRDRISSDRAPMRKVDARQWLEGQIGRKIPTRGFESIWNDEAPDTWKRPGPKGKGAERD